MRVGGGVRKGKGTGYSKNILRGGLRLGSLLLILCAASSPAGTDRSASIVPPKLTKAYGGLPLAFEANQGQSDPRVKFLARGAGYTVFITGDGAVLSFRERPAGERLPVGEENAKLRTQRSKFENPNWPSVPHHLSLITRHFGQGAAALQMCMVNANPQPATIGLDPLPGVTNYLLGNRRENWRMHVRSYARVLVRDAYPGIDLIYYGANGQLEYDFVVSPGANPKAIRLQMEIGNWKLETGNWKFEIRNSKFVTGDFKAESREAEPEGHQSTIQNPKSKTAIDRNVDLVIATENGKVLLHKPVIYQPRMSSGSSANSEFLIRNSEFVDGRYVLTAKNRIGFEIPRYDKTRPLVIDPVLSYSTYLGGAASDYAYALAVDATGSAYVTGYANSPDFPLGSTASATPGGGTCGVGLDTYPCFDVFITKLNPAGTGLVYTTYLGGGGDDVATGIAIDSAGNAYIAGYTNSNNLSTSGAAQATFGGGTCGVVPTTYPCYDAFAAKLDSQGALLYCTYLGGNSDDIAQGIAVGAAGNAFVAGFATSADFPVKPGALQSSFAGSISDAFVTKLDPAGTAFVYSTYLGGSGEDYATKVRVDSSGAAYVAGYTNSGDFPTLRAFQSAPGGGTCGPSSGPSACFDAFVTKLTAEGAAFVYSTYLGGNGGDYAYGLAIDDDGDAYVTGSTTSTNFPVSAEALKATGGGISVDAFVTKLDATGSQAIYSTYLGGLGTESSLDVALDAARNAYVAGYAYGSGFPVANSVQATNAGFYDAFVAELNAAGTELIFSTYLGGSGNEKAHGLALDPSGNIYLTGGTFSVNFPVTPGAVQPLYGGEPFDAFVAKLAIQGHPGLMFSAPSVSFEDQGVNTTGAKRAVTLTNADDAPLALASIDVIGDFSQTNDCGGVLTPGAGCTLSIAFAPTALGARSGAVSIVSSAAGSPHSIALSGSGVVAFGLSADTDATMLIKGADTAEFHLAASSAFGFSGGIALECSGTAAAVCAFDPPAISPGQSSKLTVRNLAALTADSLSFAVTGTSGAQTASATLVIRIADFALAASPAEASVAAGEAATYTVTLTPLNGFNQVVELSCSGKPQAASCSLVPASRTLTGASAASVTLTLKTTVRSMIPPGRESQPRLPWTSSPNNWIWLLPSILAWRCARAARQRARTVAASLACVLACLLLWPACGGGGGSFVPPPPSSGTPAGTYTVTVDGSLSPASSGTLAPLSHQTTLKLTVY